MSGGYDNYVHITQTNAKNIPNCNVSFASGSSDIWSRDVLFLELYVTFYTSNISTTAEWICARFAGKACFVPRSDEFKCQGYQGQKRLLALLSPSAMEWSRLLIMAALRSRCEHYIFALWFLLSSFFLSSPNLSGRGVDVYHTSAHCLALV